MAQPTRERNRIVKAEQIKTGLWRVTYKGATLDVLARSGFGAICIAMAHMGVVS